MSNTCLVLCTTSSYCRLYATLVIVIGGGHKEVTTASYHTICKFVLGFIAFCVVLFLLCAALIIVDGTVVTTSYVSTRRCPCLFPPFPPLFPLFRLFGMLGSKLMVTGRWIGGPCLVAFSKVWRYHHLCYHLLVCIPSLSQMFIRVSKGLLR